MNQQALDTYIYRRLTEEIQLMQEAIDAYRRKVAKPHVADKLVGECEVRIFNAAVNLGMFDLAMQYAKTAEDRMLVGRLRLGFLRTETSKCKCTPDTTVTRTGRVELPLVFKWSRIFNPEAGAWVDVYKCSKCNFVTMHPNAQCAYRAKNIEKSASQSGKKPLTDSEVLSQ